MNMIDDVRGVGVIKMMMVDDVGEGGVENDRKSDDVICGRPLTLRDSHSGTIACLCYETSYFQPDFSQC